MLPSIDVRSCATAALFVILLLSLTTISAAVDFAPIDGNTKTVPEVIPCWDMGEPGSDPGWRTSTVSTPDHNREFVDPPRVRYRTSQNKDIQCTEMIKIFLLSVNYWKFGFGSYSRLWSR